MRCPVSSNSNPVSKWSDLLRTMVRWDHWARIFAHVDYSARIQTVSADTNPLFHRLLLRAFKALSGCPVLVNTSFNVRGEPIVCAPEDAFRCFMGNELDVLVVGHCLLKKSEQDSALKQDYSSAFELD